MNIPAVAPTLPAASTAPKGVATAAGSSKPDILSSLMQSNLSSLAPAPSPNNGWHSANPLVMNHQLASPQASNNNFSSLDDLDPFGSGSGSGNSSGGAPKPNNTNGANMYTLQQPQVNYIYPTGYSLNSIQQQQQQQSLSMKAMAPPQTLVPQTQTLMQGTDNQNINALSQQDILNFLN